VSLQAEIGSADWEGNMKENPGLPGDFARGVDISDTQGAVDWKIASAAGVTFAYVIATRGLAEQKPHFAPTWLEMKRGGVLRGACHYFQPLKDAESQALHFANAVGKLDDLDLPPALRLKAVQTHTGLNEWDSLRYDGRLAAVMRCLTAMEKAFGRKPVIFSNEWFVRSQLRDTAQLGTFDLWISSYGKMVEPAAPAPWKFWKFWRYSDSGEIEGIEGRVSLDYFHGTHSDLQRYAAGTEASGAPGAAVVEEPQEQTVNAEAAEPLEESEDEKPQADQSKPARPPKRQPKTQGT
jgi:GH25 family lysozyme M1 (1,4-beta-N-acetylmuramidase)